jgi:hypothetical protein
MLGWPEARLAGFRWVQRFPELVATIRDGAPGRPSLLAAGGWESPTTRSTAVERSQWPGEGQGQLTTDEFEDVGTWHFTDGSSMQRRGAIWLFETLVVEQADDLEKLGVTRRSDAVAVLRQRGILQSPIR